MESAEIREKFLRFFEARGHVRVASSSLIPDDPSVLLTTAGMQQFKKYYTVELDAQKDFRLPDGAPAKGVVSIQKSFRTSDIDEVGDETHNTFFEMLGNFSFGGYWKKEAIGWAHEFLTKELSLSIAYVTIFKGSQAVPKDEESAEIWRSLGIMDIREEGMEDVFWGPTGASGPCGPTTEVYCKTGDGRAVENWNIVFNEYFCNGSREALIAGNAELAPLKTKGIDTGMGLERLAMVAQKKKNMFETDLFTPLFKDFPSDFSEREKRIIADHARATAFLIADGVRPSNKGQGYILRRLMRRMIVQHAFAPSGSMQGGHGDGFDAAKTLARVAEQYAPFYPELKKDIILRVFNEERDKYEAAINKGIKEMQRLDAVDADKAFYLFESFGLTFEAIRDIAGDKAKDLTREAFDEKFRAHQEKSRAGAEKKFGGHGLVLDTGELKAGNDEEMKKVLRLHTATHLLQQALREVLGPEVHQAGSDITPERTRFDFSFPRKMTPEEIRKAEDLVNQKIKEDLPVAFKEMSKAEAEKADALHFFKEKYPEKVKVYFVGPDLMHAWSKEFCGGPHVTHTGEIRHFRIAKEEAVGAGIRRIRGILDK